ncbi:MAG TPA: lamin tail domain-containing protein, partial [Phycisphaerae bacterium]|nr:lamin tail domain-containing protein [Phycisphaerae bacterium]
PSLVLRDNVLPALRARRAAWRKQETWRPSEVDDGSPGIPEPTPEMPAGSVVVNEMLAHSDGYPNDWIEIRNTTDQPIDIGGWYLSDDIGLLTKYQIAPGTILPASDPEDDNAGYLVFTQDDHFGDSSGDPGVIVAFALSEHGDEVFLSSANIDVDPGAYRDYVVFGATENSVTSGRYVTSTGRAQFVALSAPTAGPTPDPYDNAEPLVGPLVIEEIMYHPTAGEPEYLLLRNVTGKTVDLHDAEPVQSTWKFTEGIEFTFPPDVSVPAGGLVLLTNVEPATYRASHYVPAEVQLFGPYVGALSDGGETITLAKPGGPETLPEPFVPYITAESVKYNDNTPWPAGPDGNGPALGRLLSLNYGNDSVNWGPSAAPVHLGWSLDASGGPVQPELTFSFSGNVFADGGAVTALDDGGTPVAATISNSGSDSLVVTFDAPLTYGRAYTVVLSEALLGDRAGRAVGGGPIEATFMAALDGDANLDGMVDADDYVRVKAHLGQTDANWTHGDFDGSGVVDRGDFWTMAANFGSAFTPPPPAAGLGIAPPSEATAALAQPADEPLDAGDESLQAAPAVGSLDAILAALAAWTSDQAAEPTDPADSRPIDSGTSLAVAEPAETDWLPSASPVPAEPADADPVDSAEAEGIEQAAAASLEPDMLDVLALAKLLPLSL